MNPYLQRRNSEKRVRWDIDALFDLDNFDEKCYRLSQRDVMALLAIHPQSMWRTRWQNRDQYTDDEIAGYFSELINDLMNGEPCEQDAIQTLVNNQSSEEGCDEMCCTGKLTRLNGQWYVINGLELVPFSGTAGAQSYTQSELVPNASNNGYVVNSDDFTGQQFGGETAFLGLSDCEASTAFVDYLLESTRNLLQQLINALEISVVVITAEVFLNIIEDVPILGSITQEVAEEIIRFPENVLRDAEGLLDNLQYRYIVQRAMYGLIANNDVVLSRGLLQTWARNTPFIYGSTNTPMQGILYAAMTGVDMGVVQRLAPTFRGNGDPELCQLFAEDTNIFPAGSQFDAGGFVAAGYYATSPVAVNFNDEELPQGTPSVYTDIGTVYTGNLPAGAVVGVLITLVNHEHSNPDSNGSTVRIGIFDENDGNILSIVLGISDIGDFSNATLRDASSVNVTNTQILATNVQAVSDAYPNALTGISGNVLPSTPEEVVVNQTLAATSLYIGVSINSFASSTVGIGNWTVQLIIDEAVLPQ